MNLRQAIKIIKQRFLRGMKRDHAKAAVRKHRFSKQVQRHYGFDRRDFREEVISEFKTRFKWKHES
jgi:hypothetical protein